MKQKIRFLLDPKNSLYILEKVCFTFGVLSVFFSLTIMLLFGGSTDLESAHNQRLALFVGLWAPTLIGIANYLKRR
jgi:hypothetical protein